VDEVEADDEMGDADDIDDTPLVEMLKLFDHVRVVG
jgi:hypothetical protein